MAWMIGSWVESQGARRATSTRRTTKARPTRPSLWEVKSCQARQTRWMRACRRLSGGSASSQARKPRDRAGRGVGPAAMG
jgi:hypothetical protein